MNMYCTIALLSPPYTSLTYTLPPWLPQTIWKPGLRVPILLGKSMLRIGLILSIDTNAPNLPKNTVIRPLLWPLEKTPLLSSEYVQMIQQLALRQSVHPGQILATILPIGLRTTQIQIKSYTSEIQPIALKELKNKNTDELMQLGALWTNEDVDWTTYRKEKNSELCVLATDPPWSIRPSAHRQRILLDFLFENGSTPKNRVLQTLGNEYRTALTTLVQYGLVVFKKYENLDKEKKDNKNISSYIATSTYMLTQEQQEAVAIMKERIVHNQSETFLLFGVTGSGKTAVYVKIIQECLLQKRSVLLLAPEVALAHKLKNDIETAFPNNYCYLVHGYQSSQHKEHFFRELAKQDAQHIVIGTRSALFLPLCNIGSIILDEEHDSSFKQEERFVYQAKEIAWFRAKQSNAILVLGSATPDIKTFYAAKQSKLTIVTLPSRVGVSSLPQIKLIDIRHVDLKETVFASESLNALEETIKAGEQAIILLNRRGYAPTIYCIGCGKSVRCPHCDIGMTYHKARESLICHYCGYVIPFPSPCPSCKSIQFHPMGQGTEKVEEEIYTRLPSTNVLRLDYDTTRRVGQTESILKSFASNEAQILVGTQMISKGHHFPNVTLVIIANGDMGLNLPDYRTAEKTFQLLTQAAGRAGRGDKPGQVLIQTHDVTHYCWKFIQQHDYIGFYEHEIALREKWHYPPFTHLALLRFSYPAQWTDGKLWLKKITTQLQQCKKNLDVSIRGPVTSPIPMLRGRYRYQCLLKGNSWQTIRTVFNQIQSLMLHKNFRIALDIDPIDML